MPVATFADFVAEQAVAIAVGAAAVVLAPKAGPKLAELGSDLSAKAKTMIDPSTAPAGETAIAVSADDTEAGAATEIASASAGAATLAAAARSLAEKLAGGAQRISEQWSDLLAEAEAEKPAPDGATAPSAAELLASVSSAVVVSYAPGRVRLRLHALRGWPEAAHQVGEALAALDGVRSAQANATTGSVLILFDASRYPSAGALLETMLAEADRLANAQGE